MGEVLKKFGRYILLDLIAQGGMAEIYRARLTNAEGAGRLLVIKRIQAGFGSNNEFLQMFKSEIKVSMAFNHSNIVQLYDFGEENNMPYIAMEFVDGRNLRQFLNRFNEQKQQFPIELATHIIEQAASALHYAHHFKDKITGEHLNIVHRDISPQNIIISYEGNVKVIDFGIAKAKTNSEHTRAGVIKGKPSYLAPEQISGDPMDGRTDLFALGTVFWELLVGKKLFSGENDLAVLKMIESCPASIKKPSEFNPNVPPELDAIILKVLEKRPEKRYQTGEELQRALRRFLNTYSPDFSPGDLSPVIKELFNKEIVEDRKKIQQLNEKVEHLLLTEIPALSSSDKPTEKGEDTTTFVSKSKPIEYKLDPDTASQQVVIEQVRPQDTRTATRQSAPTKSGTSQNTFSQTKTNQGYASAKSSSGGGSGFLGFVALLLAALGVSYMGPQYGIVVPVVSAFLGAVPAPKKLSIDPVVQDPGVNPFANQQNGAFAKNAKVKLNVYPSGPDLKVTINGKQVDSGNLIDVAVGSPVELLVEKPGYQNFRSEFSIDPRSLNAQGEYVKEVALELIQDRSPAAAVVGDNFGYLTVVSTPSAEVTIFIDGKLWGRKFSPFDKFKVPTGNIKLHMYNPTLDLEDVQEFKLVKDQAKPINSTLRPKSK